VGPVPRAGRAALGADLALADLARRGRAGPLPVGPSVDDECAVLFTSGATGPAKGVVYRHRQLQAQVELLRGAYQLGREDRIVAAFAPFSLYGPALGIGSVVPDMDVTAPGTLTAAALADAVAAIGGSVVFASPAAGSGCSSAPAPRCPAGCCGRCARCSPPPSCTRRTA
jgi:acyl-coenzyme A synthetase/AMP-(fatty) acid ligase